MTDHVAMPRSLAAKVTDAQLRYHNVVLERVEIDMDFEQRQQTAWTAPSGDKSVSVKWHGDKLMHALRGSHERHQVLAAVEGRLAE
eukprot:5458606-Pyramimonas_sp.AAC.1